MDRTRLFLSYHTSDQKVAECLTEGLAAHAPDLSVFFAPRVLRAGAFWIPALTEAIEEADAFLLLLGAKSPGPWQLLEYFEAIDRKAKQPDFPVVPVLLGDAAPRLPFLRQIHWLQFPDPTADEALERLLPALRGEALGRVAEPWRAVNPYRGLLALTDADVDFFFGREDLTKDLIDRLRQGQRFLTLIGNSGVGKSSLVQAGVVASLRRQSWPDDVEAGWPHDLRESRSWLFLTMKPGNRPLDELARLFVSQWTETTDPRCGDLSRQWAESLRRTLGIRDLVRAITDQFDQQYGVPPPRRFVLVVDQAEELYTRSPIESARRFTEVLAEGLEQQDLMIIMSLRSDHYGYFQTDEHLFPITTCVDVPPLRENDLRRVVSRPAEILHARFEDEAMADRIAAATAREPGALPLLSYLMEGMWKNMQRRGNGILHWADYPELTGVRGVLAQRAEDYFEACSGEQQKALKRLFTLRLAHVPVEGEVVRRRARQNECSEAEWNLVQEIAGPNWRLLVIGEEAGESIAEVAHEVLLRGWERLAQWLAEEQTFLQWKGQLDQARMEWQSAERDPEALLGGLALTRAIDWLADHEVDLSEHDRAFIAESVRRREREQIARERRRWGIVALSLFAALIAGAFAWVAYDRSKEANEARARADEQAIVARSAAQAQIQLALGNPARGVLRSALLATESLRRAHTLYGYVAWAEAMSLLPRRVTKLSKPKDRDAVWAMALSPQGDRLAVVDDNTVELWDLIKRREVVRLEHDARVNDVAFSPAGNLLAFASADKTARVVDLATQKEMARLGHDTAVTSVRFSSKGDYLVTTDKAPTMVIGDVGNTVWVWDLARNKKVTRLEQESRVREVTFSPEDDRMAIRTEGKAVRLWDLVSGRDVAHLEHEETVTDVAFSPKGDRLATASTDNTVRLWDAATGRQMKELPHQDKVVAIAFNLKGDRLVAASQDNTTWVWDLESGQILDKHSYSGFGWVTFSSDGSRLASVGAGVRIWNAMTGQELARLPHEVTMRTIYAPSGQVKVRVEPAVVYGILFSPQGNRLVTTSGHRALVSTEVRLWDLDTGPELFRLQHRDEVLDVVFDRKGDRLTTASQDGTVRLWSLATGEELARLENQDGAGVRKVVFSPDGRRLAGEGLDNVVFLWDLDTSGEPIRLEHEDTVTDVAFSPDGTRLATASLDKTVRLWDPRTGERLETLEHSYFVVKVLFSPRGGLLAIRDRSDAVRVWDLYKHKELARLEHEYGVIAIAFSPDGSRLATTTGDRWVWLWDPATGRELTRLEYQGGSGLGDVVFSPDGKRLAATVHDELFNNTKVALWDLADGFQIAEFEHAGPTSVVFSPDSKFLATATGDQSVSVWDLVTHRETVHLKHPGGVTGIVFSPDGTRITTTSTDGFARVWLWRTGDLVHEACSRVERNLTPEEWRQFFGDSVAYRSTCSNLPVLAE
jgi:WD40 repeat protein